MNTNRHVNSRVIGMAAMVFGLAFLGLTVSTQAAAEHSHHNHTPLAMTESVTDDSLHQLPALWQDHRNQPLALKDLSGQAVIVTMIYAGCQTACPVLVEDVKRLYHTLDDAQQANTRVLVVSFDAQNDTPEVLHNYAQNMGADRHGWHFVTGDQSDIRTIAAVLGIRYRENPSGGFDHSNVIAVLDREGEIIGRQEGLMQSSERLASALRSALN